MEKLAPIILVVEGVQEIREGLERLLKKDGYRVDEAKNEQDAIGSAAREPPNLILVSCGSSGLNPTAMSSRVRRRAGLGDEVPVVVFSAETIDEGAEVEVAPNVYLTRPDNFNQLRALLGRLLEKGRPGLDKPRES